MSDWLKQTWADIEPNVKWDVINWTASAVAVMVAAGVGLFQRIVHLTVDWWILGGVFIASFVCKRQRKHTVDRLWSKSLPESTGCGGLRDPR